MAGHTISHASGLWMGNARHPLQSRRGVGPLGNVVFHDYGVLAAADASGISTGQLVSATAAGTALTITSGTASELAVGRGVRITASGTGASGAINFDLTGTDIYGLVMFETVTGASASGGAVSNSKKAFASVTAATVSGAALATTITVNLGWSDVLGLPFVALDTNFVQAMGATGVDGPMTFVAAATGLNGATDGDVRGTIDHSDALATSFRPTLFMHVNDPTTVTGAYGQAQATG